MAVAEKVKMPPLVTIVTRSGGVWDVVEPWETVLDRATGRVIAERFGWDEWRCTTGGKIWSGGEPGVGLLDQWETKPVWIRRDEIIQFYPTSRFD